MKYQFLAVDLQNDFTTEGGKHYIKRPCVNFLKENIFPFFKEKSIKINEIISDYRQPRPGDRDESCVPGTWGYESIVPKEIVKSALTAALTIAPVSPFTPEGISKAMTSRALM